MARTTVENTIERIRRQLDSSIRHEVNELAAPLTAVATDTTVTVTYDLPQSVYAGAIISIGRELMRVHAINRPAKEMTVRRAWQDSPLEAHAALDEVLQSPRFTRFDIYDGIVNEISSWGDRLFRVVSYEWASVTDEEDALELPLSLADAVGVVSLRRQWTEDSDRQNWPTLGFRLMRGDPATWSGASLSGLLIRLLPQNGVKRAGIIHAEIAVPFDVTTLELEESDDLVADVGLAVSMVEVVELGVKARIMVDAENSRSSRHAQDEPRRAEEVQAGSALTVGQTLRRNYEQRFAEEMAKLNRKYPVRAW